MPSLLLSVFILQLFIYLINTVGAAAITDSLWRLFSALPTKTSAAARAQTKLRIEVLRLKREMNATSSQDEFARWAKLRRLHDKAVGEYEEKSSTLQTSRATFDSTVAFLRWSITNGLRLFLQFWFAKRALFWVPRGWVPGYVEWMLAFPRAPRGSVGIQIWWLACATVVQLVGSALAAAWVLMMTRDSGVNGRIQKEGIKVGAGGAEKKEL